MEGQNIEVPFSDGALEAWVGVANRYGVGIGVTLQIGGLLVSGSTTSGGDFLRYLGESLAEAAAKTDSRDEIGETFKNIYEKMARELYPLASEESGSSEERQSTSNIAFIHLKDATVWIDSQSPPIKVEYWRGRLDSVDAWFLGTMSKA